VTAERQVSQKTLNRGIYKTETKMRVPLLQNAPQNSKGNKYSPIILKQGVCHTVALPFTLKKVSEGRRSSMEIQIFHHAKIYLQKNPLKDTKILQAIVTL